MYYSQRLATTMEYHRHFVLVTTFCQNAVTVGFFYGFSRLLPALVEEYDLGRAQAGLIQSVGMAVFALVGVATGLLIERFGSRTIGMVGALLVAIPVAACFFTNSLPFLVVACGFFPGIGLSFSYLSAPAAVGRLYEGKARSLALTIVSSGNSVGAVAYAYLMEFLLNQYNLRGTFFVCGAIVLNAVWLIMIWPRRKKQQKTNPEMSVISKIEVIQGQELHVTLNNETHKSDNRLPIGNKPRMHNHQISNNLTHPQGIPVAISKLSAFKTTMTNLKMIFGDKAYAFFAFGSALFLVSEINTVVYLPDFVIDKSGVLADGAFALFLFSILGIVGRFLPGFLKQLPRVSVMAAPLASTVLSLAAKVMILLTDPVIYTMIGVAVSGLSYGVQLASLSVATAKLIGERNIPVGMGVIFTLFGVGAVVVGPLFGYIRDATGSYVVPYQCSIGLLVASVLLTGASVCIRRRHKVKDQA